MLFLLRLSLSRLDEEEAEERESQLPQHPSGRRVGRKASPPRLGPRWRPAQLTLTHVRTSRVR